MPVTALAHFYQSIPGWCDFADYYAEVVKGLPDNAHIVEVGAWQGKSTACMAVELLNSGKSVRFDVVDHFKGSAEIPESKQPADQRAAFLANLEPVRQQIHEVHECLSWKAADRYCDESLDFVFIDAAHDEDSVSRDLAAWWPKVRPGGIMAGHDLDREGVRAALTAFGADIQPIPPRTWEVRKPQALP